MLTFLSVQIINLVIQNLNSNAKIIDVYRNCGCAILIMIVATILTSRLTNAGKGTAQMAGNGARVELIIGAYLNGYSVMAKMIVVMALTNFPKIVRSVTRPVTSNVKVIDAFPSEFFNGKI